MKRDLFLSRVFALVAIFSMLLSSVPQASAIGLQDDGDTRIGYNAQTGKVSFIGAPAGRTIQVFHSQASLQKPDGIAMDYIHAYATDFGLKNPETELQKISGSNFDKRSTSHYQQVYRGIPVMGGELVVNTDETGGLLSSMGKLRQIWL